MVSITKLAWENSIDYNFWKKIQAFQSITSHANQHHISRGGCRDACGCSSSLPRANGKSNLGSVFNSLLISRTPAQLNGVDLSDMIQPPHKFLFTSTVIDDDHYDDSI